MEAERKGRRACKISDWKGASHEVASHEVGLLMKCFSHPGQWQGWRHAGREGETELMKYNYKTRIVYGCMAVFSSIRHSHRYINYLNRPSHVEIRPGCSRQSPAESRFVKLKIKQE